MTHKDFLTEVQHRCGLDRQTCSVLMQSAVKLMAEQATEQIAVEWEGIGTFVATKHPEYVAEDPESGLQTMFPPRITYRLSQQTSANPDFKGLNATQFKFHLARYAKATEGDAEYFMHMVGKVILEHLDQNDPVEIQGLGVFSWVESQQGRRMSLQVDEKMRSLVNAPFACFEPMVMAVEMKKEEPAPEVEPEPAPESPDSPELPDSPEPEPEPEVVPEPASPDSPESPESPETPEPEPAPEPTPETPATEPDPEPAPAPVKKRVREPEPTLMDKIQPLLEWVKSQPRSMQYCGAGFAALLLLLIIWLILPSSKEEPKVDTAPTEQLAIERDVEEPDSPETLEAPESPESPESSAPTPKSEAKSAPKPAPKPATKPAPKPASVASPARGSKPSNDMLLMENGSPKMDKLGDGGRLTLVALRNYGDKAFWAYVYDVNAFQLGNPNNVPIGLPLYLPDPTYFKIDASDPASIKRAQNRAMQILREWE